jgi:hypothetical protein
MSAPTTTRAADERQRLARIAKLDAGWRRLAHVGDGNTHPATAATKLATAQEVAR